MDKELENPRDISLEIQTIFDNNDAVFDRDYKEQPIDLS